MSISSILDISKRALLSHRSAIGTTSQNISNINTLGYSRRRTNFEALDGSQVGFTRLQSNISGDTITRVRDHFIDQQLNRQNTFLGKYRMDATVFKQIEDIFGEPHESGLSNTLSEFWNSWSELANDPESQNARMIVHDKALSLEQNFHRIYNDMTQLQKSIEEEITQKVGIINQKLNQIKSINGQIVVHQSDDLLDQRDLLVKQLSEIIEIESREGANGAINLFANGQILVSGMTINELTTERLESDELPEVAVQLKNSGRRLEIKAGELGSLMEVHNRDIPDYIEQLNSLAINIAKAVNTIHRHGYNLDGVTGVNFFATQITSAGNFKVSHYIRDDASLIASASVADEPGNGAVAQALSDIQYNNAIKGNTLSEFYNSLVTAIGSRVQESEYLRESQSKVVQSLQNQQDSASAVSLDEEMVNLTKYEQGYQAAAKVVNTVNDLMITVLELI